MIESTSLTRSVFCALSQLGALGKLKTFSREYPIYFISIHNGHLVKYW